MALCIVNGLGENGAHTAIWVAFENMWAVNLHLAAVIGTVHLEGELCTRNKWLQKDRARGVIDKFEIRVRDIDSGIHTVGSVVFDRVGMVSAIGNFESSIDGGTEHGTRNLADTAAEFWFSAVIFNDQFWKIAMLTIYFPEIFDKGKFLIGSDEDTLELFQCAVDIEDAVFWRTGEIRRSFGNKFCNAKTFDIGAFDIRGDDGSRNIDRECSIISG